MIDAIKFYSSTHGGRIKNPTPTFQSKQTWTDLDSDIHIATKKAPQKQSELGSFLFLSGCFGAFSLIADTLANSNQLMKSNFEPIKDILKFAGIWSLIGAAMFGLFKAIEHAAIDKVKPQQP